MIDKTELIGYKTYGDPYQVEKDYLQDLLLHAIYSKSEAQMVFKGGTALSKFYYSGRFSEDLDFTLMNVSAGPQAYIKRLLDDVIEDMEYSTEYKEEPRENRFKTISAAIIMEGPRYDVGRSSTLQHVRFEINTTGALIFAPANLSRQPKYRDTELYLAPVMDKRDILAEKFRAIMSKGRRHRERDLYDMSFLFDKGVVPDINMISKKFEETGRQFAKEALMESIRTIEPTWNDLVPLVSHTLSSYESVKKSVIGKLKATGML